MDLSVVICTWNRADQLAEALERLAEASVGPDVSWELVIVNNNCTDHTNDVVARFADVLPVRLVMEPRQGLSFARNRGIEVAKGELLLWTDDDVAVGDQWINAYAAAAKRHPECDFFGGPVQPSFEGSPPLWLVNHWQEVAPAFAVRDFGNAETELSETRLPFGANFAVRRAVQERFPFDVSLGRKGDSLEGGEEIAVMKAILGHGGRGMWLPAARVSHLIGRDRQSTRYLRRFYYSLGKAAGRRPRGDSDRPEPAEDRERTIAGMPIWSLRLAVQYEWALAVSRSRSRLPEWLGNLRDASYYWGVSAGRKERSLG